MTVYDLTDDSIRHTLAGHSDWVTDCQISWDNTFIVSTSFDDNIILWDIETGAEIRRIEMGDFKYLLVYFCSLFLNNLNFSAHKKFVKMFWKFFLKTFPHKTFFFKKPKCSVIGAKKFFFSQIFFFNKKLGVR